MIFQVDPDHPEPRRIKRIAEVLRSGGVIAYPTDTVYGLGCDINSKKALERVRRIKKIDSKRHLSFVFSHLPELFPPPGRQVLRILLGRGLRWRSRRALCARPGIGARLPAGLSGSGTSAGRRAHSSWRASSRVGTRLARGVRRTPLLSRRPASPASRALPLRQCRTPRALAQPAPGYGRTRGQYGHSKRQGQRESEFSERFHVNLLPVRLRRVLRVPCLAGPHGGIGVPRCLFNFSAAHSPRRGPSVLHNSRAPACS